MLPYGGLCPELISFRGFLLGRPPYGNERAVRILLECILVVIYDVYVLGHRGLPLDGASLPRHVTDFFICTCAASTLVHFTAEIPRIEHHRKSQLINYLSMITYCRTPPGGRSSFIQSYAAHLAAGYRTETIDKIHFRVKQDVENMTHQQHRVSSLVKNSELPNDQWKKDIQISQGMKNNR